MSRKKIPGATTHPDEWGIWRAMRSRCNPRLKQTKYTQRYILNGITVCDTWNCPNTGFQQFLKDMGSRPGKEYSLDRIDNTKGYSPDNCRWATSKQQSRNRSSNRTITVDGLEVTLAEISERSGIDSKTLLYRLNAGWKVGDAVATNIQSHKITFNGETKTARAWAILLGIPITTIYNRLRKGLPVESVLNTGKFTGKYIRKSGKLYGRGIKK